MHTAIHPSDITAELLCAALQIPPARLPAIRERVPALRDALAFADISTTGRLAHYLAQIGHETGLFRYRREVWGDTPAQRRYERDPSAPWPTSPQDARRPEFRANRLAYTLGNTRPGDGRLFLGRGDIQITGRGNTRAFTRRMRAAFGESCPDFERTPALLESSAWVSLSGADYWLTRGLNRWADADDILTITRRINGGTNGLAHRQALQAHVLLVLTGVPAHDPL